MKTTKRSKKLICCLLILLLLLSPLALAQGKDGDNGVSRGGDASGDVSSGAAGASSDAGAVGSSGGTPDQDMVSAAIEAGIVSEGGFLSVDPDAVTDPDAMTTTDWVFSGLSLLAGVVTLGAVTTVQLAVTGAVYAGGKMAGAKTAQERAGEKALETIAAYAGTKSDPTATQTVTNERDWVSVNTHSGGGGANA